MSAPDVQSPRLVVGIGASAGGLAAFKAFLTNTPADTGVAFVLVQHLAPDHKSLLVELLSAQSPIPVVTASNGLAIRENCVFVIPPDATLTIRDGILHVATPAPVRELRRPIDTFFTSLAEDCGERAVGIVLAGVGSDGTIGIKSIKENGGLTLAQAEFDATALQGMPSSAVATGLVDHVMPVEAMPGMLLAYHKHMIEVAETKDDNGNRRDLQEHLADITALLHARSEHDFKGYKEPTLIRRLQRRMQVLQIDTAAGYIERLRTDQDEVSALFQELLIGVTQFFRDPEAFEALKANAIVPLLSATTDNEPVRVWVAGCSTGEEVYSIAILMRETMQDLRAREITIFGTDIDPSAIAIARTGRYRKAPLGLSSERFEKWFVRDGVDYSPVPEIRAMCVFSTHSLIKDPPFSKLDLISCRNVLIYLGDELQDRLMRTFHYALRPDGYLFLGTAESVTRNSRLFAALDKKYRVLQRRDVGARLPPLQPHGVRVAGSLPSIAARRQLVDDRTDKAVDRLMKHYAPAYFIIDRNNEITRFSGAETGHYIEPTEGVASLNLFSIVHKSLRPAVRAAVSQALAEDKRVINEDLTIRIDGQARALTLIVEPIGGDNDANSAACLVAFLDTSPSRATGEADMVTGSGADLQVLERELLGTKKQLQASTDELETRIEDMKSTTEEFQAVNEELQSSNEELETAKEEMQSVNEELQTVNGELNSKNDLLSRLNSDMQNLLESTQIATVFLDDQLCIKHFTPALMQLFPVRESDHGRSITDIVSLLDYSKLRADVDTVQTNGAVLERDLALKDSGRTFVMRIRPYRTVSNAIDGVVITFVDITERTRTELALRESERRYREMIDALPAAVYTTDAEGYLTHFNPAAVEFSGRTPELGTDKWCVSWKLYHTDGTPMPLDECLMASALKGGDIPRGAEAIAERPDGTRVWCSASPSVMHDAQGHIIGGINMLIDITDRKTAEAHQAFLSRELEHRSQNLLAVIQSIAARSLSGDRTLDEARKVFSGRLHALAHANEVLIATNWLGASLNDVIDRELAAFSGRLSIEGPHLMLNLQATQGFALIIHELCTNACKYGALSVPDGQVTISWRVDAATDTPNFVFRWQEHGGPVVSAPTRTSFGSKLLRQAITGLSRPVEIDYAPDGMVYTLQAPLTVVAAADPISVVGLGIAPDPRLMPLSKPVQAIG